MKVDNHTLKLDPSLIQLSPNNKEYKVIGLSKDQTKSPQWIGRTEKFHWIVTIRFVENQRLARFYFDYYDNCIKKEKL